MRNQVQALWKDNKSLFFFVGLMLVFRSAVADWNHVPTGSMNPTIVEGDRILIDKMAYDLRVPFSHISLLKRADPIAGDIVIFDSVIADKRLVKRVVGVPGDVVALRNNRLMVNGTRLGYSQLHSHSTDMTEHFCERSHTIRVSSSGDGVSDFTSVVVPDEHYLVLGDNRDNSADSRVIGFVPRHEIVGRAHRVVLSLNRDNYYLPRPARLFQRL